MINLHRLTKRYDATPVVHELSLTVETGEMMVVLGGSGSGKTTMLKMINRLVHPTSGTVRLDGTDTASIPPYELRRRIGYTFQQVGLFPHMSVAENIGVTPLLLGWNSSRVTRRVDELLELVELDISFRDRRPNELSGGQQQRVGVARGLAANPSVILLDEPFGSLDPLTRERLQKSFVEIHKEVGLTAIFVTHDMVEALLLGNRIAVMNAGQLVQVGTPQELLTEPHDDYVDQLMGTPRRQAAALKHLIGGEPLS